jgi:hypothetical protein
MVLMNVAAAKSSAVTTPKFKDIQEASKDFRYLLNREYPRKAALEFVGNRYQLHSDQRHLLHRGVFSNLDSEARQKKKIASKEIRNKDLAIDGYNVIITIEAGLSKRPLILGDDGYVRDISGLSGNFKKTETTERAIRLIFDALKEMKPRKTLFLFDSPISKSGIMAQEVRARLKRENLSGDARAIKVPEKILNRFPGVVATSDTAIIDQAKEVVDLAGDILRERVGSTSLLRWKKKPLRG